MDGKIENFVPTVDFELWGMNAEVKTKLSGIVDTGFNGFLKLPYVSAFPVGLILYGTETSTIANGDQTTDLGCIGTVKMFDKQVTTLISVAPNCPILIGTQLIKALGLDVHFDFHNSTLKFTPTVITPVITPSPAVEKTRSSKASKKPRAT